MDNEQCSFEIILHSGNANSSFLEAMDKIEEFKFEEAQEDIKKGEEELAAALKAHMDILVKISSGEQVICDCLLAHAFDHVVEAQCNKNFVIRLKKLYQTINK